MQLSATKAIHDSQLLPQMLGSFTAIYLNTTCHMSQVSFCQEMLVVESHMFTYWLNASNKDGNDYRNYTAEPSQSMALCECFGAHTLSEAFHTLC